MKPLWSRRKTSKKDKFRSYGHFEIIGEEDECFCMSEVCEAVKIWFCADDKFCTKVKFCLEIEF